MITSIDHITNDQGGGVSLCGACRAVLGSNPMNLPTRCPNAACGAHFVPEAFARDIQPEERFPNIRALAQGCVSGRISEWPRLKSEAREIAKLMDRINAVGPRLRALLEYSVAAAQTQDAAKEAMLALHLLDEILKT